jgi:hypothetical protein
MAFGPSICAVEEILFLGRFVLITAEAQLLEGRDRSTKFILTDERISILYDRCLEHEICGLLLHRHQWVRMRTQVQNALQAIALANGLRRGPSLWSQAGQRAIASLPLAPHTTDRRSELQVLYLQFEAEIEKLNKRVQEQACGRPGALRLMPPQE